jgi:enterobacteria phage integrase
MANTRVYDCPKFMSFDKNRGNFIVRGPDGKKRRFTDEAEARAAALALAQFVTDRERLQILNHNLPTLASCVDAWLNKREQHYVAKTGSRYNQRVKMLRIKKELGHMTVREIRPVFLEDWLDGFCRTGETFIKWRLAFIRLFAYAISQDWISDNPAEKVENRSASKLLAYNHKVRTRLDRAAFMAIHKVAEPWLQLAMEIALVTGQGRYEICNMKHADFRDGRLFVIREKVAGETVASRVKLGITAELEEFRLRSVRMMTNNMSPYIVHREPSQGRNQHTFSKWRHKSIRHSDQTIGRAGKHETYVIPGYLTKAFAEARDEAHVYDHLPSGEKPSFHEIRSLASRIMKELGIDRDKIRAMLSHADQSTTQIYLQDGAKGLTDDDYIPVEVPLTLAQMLK